MGLADARAMYPSLPVVEADLEADRRLLEAIADWCDRYTPLVGLDPPDGLLLDVTGCAHLFGGEAALARDLVCSARAAGFARPCRGGRHGRLRLGRRALWQARASSRAAKPKPRRAAAADRGAARRCRNRRRPENRRPDLRRRSRRAPARAVRRALWQGAAAAVSIRRSAASDEPITPRLPVPAAMAEQRFPEPIAREADVLGTIEHLARQLAGVLERRGEGGRLFQVALFRADGTVHRLEIGTGSPLRDPARVRKLFEERLAVLGDACDPGFGYDMVRLSALVTERTDPAQTGLAGDRPRRGTGASDRPARRALRPAPRDAAHAAGHAYSGIRGGGGAGACAAAARLAAVPPIEQDTLSAVRPLAAV